MQNVVNKSKMTSKQDLKAVPCRTQTGCDSINTAEFTLTSTGNGAHKQVLMFHGVDPV